MEWPITTPATSAAGTTPCSIPRSATLRPSPSSPVRTARCTKPGHDALRYAERGDTERAKDEIKRMEDASHEVMRLLEALGRQTGATGH